MRRVAFYTLGCKVNQYETEAMKSLFMKHGDVIVEPIEQADIYIINTCTVTSVGDKKSRQFIRKAKRVSPDAIIAVVGCYAQIAPDEVMALDGVNLVLGTDGRHKIVEFLEHIKTTDKIKEVGDIMATKDFEELEIDATSDRTRAFLKVQEGCNQYCSYCIIPFARGNIRSRMPYNVLKEVERVVGHGFKEVVLTGIHLASYGKDLGNLSLIELIEGIHDVPGLERLRLGSLEPNLITEDFVARLGVLQKVCDQFHLSLQSGSDRTLKRMNRKYTAQTYKQAVDTLRKAYPLAAITTDVIVGFPGETESDFKVCYDFCEEIGFSQMHVFPYSKREGTKAYYMPDQTDEHVKHQRAQKLSLLALHMQETYLRSFIGQHLSVLLERVDDGASVGKGHSKQHISVEVTGTQLEVNQIYKVRISDVADGFLLGEVVSS